MDWNRDIFTLYPASYIKQEMDCPYVQGKIYKIPYPPDDISGSNFYQYIGSMVSGILLSEYVFAAIKIKGVANMARNIHMLCAYWGFILMSLHLGLHWNMFLKMLDRKIHLPAGKKKYIFRILAGVIAAYGCHAFIKRQIGSYMFLKKHFVFFDYTEPLVFFMLDYIAVMGLFIIVGYYFSMFLRKKS